MWETGKYAEAVERMDRSFQALTSEEPDEDYALLAAQLGRILFFSGRAELAAERIELALHTAESLWLPEVLSQALNTKAVILYGYKGRRREGLALLRYALDVALENDLPSASLRAYYNLADLSGQSDRFQEGADFVRRGLALARRVGNKVWELQFLGQTYAMFALGEWDEVMAMTEELPDEVVNYSRVAASAFLIQGLLIAVARGDMERARSFPGRFPDAADSADVQEQASGAASEAILRMAEGDEGGAMKAAQVALDMRDELGVAAEPVKEAFVVAVDAAFRLGDLDRVEELLGVIDETPRGRMPQYLEAHLMRARAGLARRRGDLSPAEEGLKGAAGLFREMAVPFWMAVSELELAACLVEWGREDEAAPHLEEARAVLGRLKATPWLDRIEAVEGSVAVSRP